MVEAGNSNYREAPWPSLSAVKTSFLHGVPEFVSPSYQLKNIQGEEGP
jgi:hypothetical protein